MTFTGEPSKIIDIPEPAPMPWPQPDREPQPAAPIEEPVPA